MTIVFCLLLFCMSVLCAGVAVAQCVSAHADHVMGSVSSSG